ncbi:MAG: DUF6569 family protein [Solirubrobacterales bacterium]
MATKPQEGATVGGYLSGSLTTGEPDVTGPMVVYPVFGPDPTQEYTSVSRAQALGLTVKEQSGGGSVGDLIVSNPTGSAVLIYEGEEVLGGQQNRTFDKSLLIGPGESLTVPVSCVEAGRWDGSRNREEFRSSPQTADPDLRRRKARAANRNRESGLEERADQMEVWSMIAARSASLGVHSTTNASSDAFETHRERLHARSSEINLREGQIGMVFQVGDRVLALDLISRPDVFADLHAPLVQGYCLDALDQNYKPRVDGTSYADRFLLKVVGNRVFESDGISLGRGFRFENERAVGTGLVAGEELIQLSVFTNRPDDAGPNDAGPATQPTRRTRIIRPSRRQP